MTGFRRACSRVHVALCITFQLGCGDGADSSAPSPVASIALRPETANLDVGQSLTLTAFLRDADGATLPDREISWSSGDPSIVAVAMGRVTALREGAAIITASADGSSGSARIAVRKALAELSITPDSPTLAQGTFVQLSAELRGPDDELLDDRVVSWTSSDPRIVAVNIGKARGVRIGSAEIVARADGKTATTSVTVVPNVAGLWTLAFDVADPSHAVTCRGEGRAALEQAGPSVGGSVTLTASCDVAGSARQVSGIFAVEDGAVSMARLDFIQRGELRCIYGGAFAALPPTNVSGALSCTSADFAPGAALQGTWQMRR